MQREYIFTVSHTAVVLGHMLPSLYSRKNTKGEGLRRYARVQQLGMQEGKGRINRRHQLRMNQSDILRRDI